MLPISSMRSSSVTGSREGPFSQPWETIFFLHRSPRGPRSRATRSRGASGTAGIAASRSAGRRRQGVRDFVARPKRAAPTSGCATARNAAERRETSVFRTRGITERRERVERVHRPIVPSKHDSLLRRQSTRAPADTRCTGPSRGGRSWCCRGLPTTIRWTSDSGRSSIRQQRYEHVDQGPFDGLSVSLVPKNKQWVVERRAERDSIHAGTRRALDFDCLSCGACCKKNEVVLLDEDVARFAENGREALAKAPYARKRNGRVVLTDAHPTLSPPRRRQCLRD